MGPQRNESQGSMTKKKKTAKRSAKKTTRKASKQTASRRSVVVPRKTMPLAELLEEIAKNLSAKLDTSERREIKVSVRNLRAKPAKRAKRKARR
jgi:hypothetical protein